MKHTWNKTTSYMSTHAGAFISDFPSIQLPSTARESGLCPVQVKETEYALRWILSCILGDSCSVESQQVALLLEHAGPQEAEC